MAQAKTAYTAEQTAELVEAYKAEPTPATVETYATKFGKTVKSIVAKLSREGVYSKKEYVSKSGEKPISKEELADKIGEAVAGLSEAELDSLTKANKTALQKILDALKLRDAE